MSTLCTIIGDGSSGRGRYEAEIETSGQEDPQGHLLTRPFTRTDRCLADLLLAYRAKPKPLFYPPAGLHETLDGIDCPVLDMVGGGSWLTWESWQG